MAVPAPPDLAYQPGFGNEHASEALPGALPAGQNSPQRPPYGLYAEQLSGTAFTLPRGENRRSWLYRIRPALLHGRFEPLPDGTLASEFDALPAPPDPLRWDPLPYPDAPTDLVDGLVTFAGAGGPARQAGAAVHLYAATASMVDRFFYDADGDLLLVPQEGRLLLATELGRLAVAPGEIALVPRGLRFRAELPDGRARGWACESFGAPFRLPELGPIGANGLANPRDFLAPVAAFEDREGRFELVAKFQGRRFRAELDHSPLDVVAWHGTHAPYRYDLARFAAVNTVTFDHPDPSIFTVLTSPSEIRGLANVDLVVFPPRWVVAEHTFRPPWFHRNVMSEYMGLVRGAYDARGEGFVPGGGSLHACLTGHGPDAATFEQASSAPLAPRRLDDGLAFMFESRHVLRPTPLALASPLLQRDYARCWAGLPKRFTGRP